MSAMRRRRSAPMLMGQPSPSLAKINKMNMEQLTERIKALEVEQGHIANKIKNLSAMTPRDDARISLLNEQHARLGALIKIAQDRLAGKAERAQQFQAGTYRAGPRPPFRR